MPCDLDAVQREQLPLLEGEGVLQFVKFRDPDILKMKDILTGKAAEAAIK